MMEKFMTHVAHHLLLRLLITIAIVVVPTGITTTWFGAASLNYWTDAPFGRTLLILLVCGFPPVFIGTVLGLYLLERWVIRDRAIHSWRWIAIRHLGYVLVGLPIGLLLLLSMRLGMPPYSPLVESTYFVTPAIHAIVVAIIFTLLERARMTIQRRENRYQQQIENLRIEIDEIKRQQHVNEIVNSDFFQGIQDKARELRQRRAESAADREAGSPGPDDAR